MIKPMLAEGRHVVSDRYSLSNICYQVALAEQHDGLKAAREMYDWLSVVEWKATRPDLTIVLRLPVEEAARRRAERGKAATLYENDGLLAKVAGMYDREAEEMARAGQRVAIVDATGSVEETAEKVWAEVARLFER
jgi:thymidylate kinase